MDIKKIHQIMALAHKFDIEKFELSEGESKLKFTRSQNTQAKDALQSARIQRPEEKAVEPTPPTLPTQEIESSTPAFATDDILVCPMVGTFYGAPSEDAQPFVQVGDSVKQGDTVCVVEAMKMMNQIVAHKSGVIQAVLAENGTTVEFDQPLIVIQ